MMQIMIIIIADDADNDRIVADDADANMDDTAGQLIFLARTCVQVIMVEDIYQYMFW